MERGCDAKTETNYPIQANVEDALKVNLRWSADLHYTIFHKNFTWVDGASKICPQYELATPRERANSGDSLRPLTVIFVEDHEQGQN
jgi:hypothetical protein